MSLKKYKKLLWLLPMAALFIGIPFIQRTGAYLTDKEAQTNELELSNVSAEIQEPGFRPEEIVLAREMEFTKDVSVANTGTAPCYVRVYLDFSDSAVRGWSELSQDGSTYTAYADYLTTASDGWIKGADGYYYYTRLLEIGEATTELLRTVRTEFPADVDPYAYDIIVYSEAVQAVGSDGTEYDDYDDAFSNFNH